MKIAYVLSWNLDETDGVSSKIERQVRAWRSMGHEVEVFCASWRPGNSPFRANVFRRGRVFRNPLALITNRRTYRDLCDAVVTFQPDVAYMRWEPYQRALLDLMRSVPTVLEINTYFEGEAQRHAQESLVNRLRLLHYRQTHHYFDEACAGVVAVSSEILEKSGYRKFDKPLAYVPNSIPLDLSGAPVPYVPTEGPPRLVFMSAGIQPWHGVDELFELAAATVGELAFDLIAGAEFAPGTLPANVTAHPLMNKAEYLKVFEGAVCGIGSAGLFENDMDEASVLKVREYLGSGMPVITPYRDTAFLEGSRPQWVLETPNRRGGLRDSRDEIVRFVDAMRGRRISLAEVAPYVGSDHWEARRVDFLQTVVDTAR